MHRGNRAKNLLQMSKSGQFGRFTDIDCPFKLVQRRFCQCSASGLNPHPVRYCQHLSVSNYSIKAQPVSSRRRRMMSMIAAGKGQRYEWSAGRNVQFTAVWDFHLSSAQRWRAGKGEKGGAGRERSRGVKGFFFLTSLFYLMNWIPTGTWHRDESV